MKISHLSHLGISFFACAILASFVHCDSKIKAQQSESTGSKIQEQAKNERDTLPKGIQILMVAYPGHFIGGTESTIIWKDGSLMPFDDGIVSKSYRALLDSADLEDQVLAMPYPQGDSFFVPKINEDPGRIRYEPFFRKMYGGSQEEVAKKLTTIVWLPSSVNKPLRVTTVNNVHLKLKAISDELDGNKKWRKYLENPGGTFLWRKIAGSDRLSAHCFGMTLDINVKFSNYWKWDFPKLNEYAGKALPYKNSIPLEIVKVFEKHGFIWGGKWQHYDTMHFEYRPELLLKEE